MTNSITVGVGVSIKATVEAAVEEAWASVEKGLSKQPPSIILAYAGVSFNQAKVVETIRGVAGDVPVVGGSSQGVSAQGVVEERPRFLAIAALSGVRYRVATVEDITQDSREAGRQLAAQLGPAPEGPHTTLIYYDPLGGGDVQAVLGAMADGGYKRIFGGATGQPWGVFVKTYQYAGDHVNERGATVVVLEGLRPIAELTHGAESIGLAMAVTRAEGNVVYELDGRPALDVWCEQLGVEDAEHVESTANWALGVKPPDGAPYEGLITRAPFALDAKARSLVFQAAIPVGSTVQVCVRSQEAVYDGAMAMATRLREAIGPARPVLALGFECGARPEPFLGHDLAHKEVCDIQQAIGADIPWLGMYAWGEIAPIGEISHFHNYTFPLCVLAA